jgi:hypothetical protein
MIFFKIKITIKYFINLIPILFNFLRYALISILKKSDHNKEIIIHIGLPKTASTSFQKFLDFNHKILLEENIYAAKSDMTKNYQFLELAEYVLRKDLETHYQYFSGKNSYFDYIKFFVSIKKAIFNPANTIIFSHEDLSWIRTTKELCKLRRVLLPFKNIKIIYVKRNKSDWLDSYKKQLIKSGITFSCNKCSVNYVKNDSWMLKQNDVLDLLSNNFPTIKYKFLKYSKDKYFLKKLCSSCNLDNLPGVSYNIWENEDRSKLVASN